MVIGLVTRIPSIAKRYGSIAGVGTVDGDATGVGLGVALADGVGAGLFLVRVGD